MTLTNANVPQAGAGQKAVVPPPVATNPQPTQQSGPQEPVFDQPMIKAVPLSDPDFDSIRPKNPMHKLYWANRGHQNGIRVGYRQAQGFRLATKDDVLDCPSFMLDPSGQIINGDRVLMIIGKNAYEGALLNNHNKAIRRASKFGQVSQNWAELPDGRIVPADSSGNPIDVVAATISEVRASASNKAKVRPFVPGAAEIDALLSSPSGPQKS